MLSYQLTKKFKLSDGAPTIYIYIDIDIDIERDIDIDISTLFVTTSKVCRYSDIFFMRF